MFSIARRQIHEGFIDAKFIFMALLIMIAFIANGIVYTDRYTRATKDWTIAVQKATDDLSANCDNLQNMSGVDQSMVRPFPALSFLADDGVLAMPNSLTVNAFAVDSIERQTRSNDQIPTLPAIDWIFIVGTLMTLLTVLIGYGVVCGEKCDGTLRLVLANHVSRMDLFLGKYLGMLMVLTITLLTGALISLSILVFNNVLPLTPDTLIPIAWALIISIMTMSLVLLLTMAVSSIASTPAVSMIVTLVVWVISIFAIPGIARLFRRAKCEIAGLIYHQE